MMRITVVGAGPGRMDLLTEEAKQIIAQADVVLTTERFSGMAKQLSSRCRIFPFSELLSAIQSLSEKQGSTAVLVSGDTGFYSAAKVFHRAGCEIVWVNGISSLQYLCAKCKVDYRDVVAVSVHGRDGSAIPYICYHPKVFVLTGGKQTVSEVLSEMVSCGLGNVKVTVGENLSLTKELLCSGKAAELEGKPFGEPAVMLVDNESCAKPWETLRDADFIRGKVPMTKEDIRVLSVEKLAISPEDVVYDIGAGTGSVSVAMARKAYHSFVYAIECQQEAVELLRRNREKHRAYNLKVICAEAPEGLDGLPKPDKVFIGGSRGRMGELFDKLTAKNPAVKMVVNAVTLETLQETCDCMKRFGYRYQVTCVNSSKSEEVGRYHMMKAQNPVYIVDGEPDENS